MIFVTPLSSFSVKEVERQQFGGVEGDPLDSANEEVNLFVRSEEAQIQTNESCMGEMSH